MNLRAYFHHRRRQDLPKTRKLTSLKALKARLVLLALESRDLPSNTGLVAAYNFSEGHGTTIADASGHGNTGTLSNVAWSSAGKFGNALSFNGTNSIVNIPDSATLDLTNGMTLEAWVQWTGTSNGWKAVIAKDASNDIDYALYAVDGPGAPPAVHVVVDADTPAPGTSTLPPSTWMYLAGTYDGSTLRLYENGNLVTSRAVSGDIAVTPYGLHLGGDVAGEYFQGLLSQVRIYRRALSQAEINADMNTPVGFKHQRLRANAGPAQTVAEGSSATFAGSVNGGRAPLTYAWDFGDGSTGSGTLTPTHTYANQGSYTATLTVTDARMRTASSTTTVTVTDVASPPVANAGPAQTVAEGGSATFAGSVTGGTAPLTYAWDFGDGSTGSGTLTPTHTYVQHGFYTATLTVTDAQNRTSSSSTTVTVTDVPPTVNAGGPYTSGVGVAVAFHGSATDPGQGDSDGFTWSWSFGDGATSTVQNPSHIYTTAGTYHVTLTVREASGLSGSDTTTVTVGDAGLANPIIVTPYDRIPNFGYTPTIVSVASGNWSDPNTWSLGRLPTDGDIVDIMPGNTVIYDVNSSVVLNTIAIQDTGILRFRTDIDTQVIVGNFEVLPGGYLEVGTAANPVAGNVLANIAIANQPINTAIDPQQFGTGLIVMGKMTSHGAQKTPYVTLAQEAHAGDTTLHLASPSIGWHSGDFLVLPDTHQLNDSTRSTNYRAQWEELVVQSVSADGLTVTLTAPLRYNHLGAHDANGVLNYLPHVINREGSIMIGSIDEGNDPGQTRGYTLFTYRADVDIENTGFCELGRTTNTAEDDTTFDSHGNVTHIGTNQGDRTPMTAHNLLGPNTPQANGYQFTFIGNVVDDDASRDEANQTHQWGIVLNNSFYGLIQDNVVYNAAGAGIGVEDGASSYNRFDANLVMRVLGTSSRPDQQLQGDGFYFHNPNNYITDNIATDINGSAWDVYSYGFDIDASGGVQGGGVGTVRVPASQGADPSVAGQSRNVNMNDTPLLDFSDNEIYGATPSGLTLWWIGTYGDTFYADAQVSVVQSFTAWNFGTKAIYGYPVNRLTIDGLVVRGDTSQLNDPYNHVKGVNFDDYMTHSLIIQNADIQGMATGIDAPMMVGRVSDMDTTLIQNSYLDNRVNIELTPPRSVNGSSGLSPMTLDVTNVSFAHPSVGQQSWWSDISLDPVTSDSLGTSNFGIPQYVYVHSYNGDASDNFEVFYARNHPADATTRALINGYVRAM